MLKKRDRPNPLRYLVYNDIKQIKAATPHRGEAGNTKCSALEKNT